MGSFLVSCGASNNVIQEGEECYLMPIVLNITDTKENKLSLSNSPNVVEHTWKSVRALISVIYNDYGNYLPNYAEGTGILDQVIEYVIKYGEFKKKTGRDTFDPEQVLPSFVQFKSEREKCFKKLVYSVTNESTVSIRTEKTNIAPSPLSFMVIKKSAVDYFMDKYDHVLTIDNINDENDYKTSNGIETCTNFLKIKAENVDNPYLKYSLVSTITTIFESLYDYKYETHDIYKTTDFMDVMYDNFDSIDISNIADSKELYLYLYNWIVQITPPDIMDNLRKFNAVITGFTLCNIQLTPVLYAGQDYENRAGTNYCELVKHINQIETAKQELYDE